VLLKYSTINEVALALYISADASDRYILNVHFIFINEQMKQFLGFHRTSRTPWQAVELALNSARTRVREHESSLYF
jgi:hypothetical protein